MATNSKNFRIGKSIEEIMVQRNMEADTLPPVHTSQQLQRTISRANKSRRQASSRSSATPLDTLRHSGSAGKIPSPRDGTHPTYENFIMESMMEHCRTLQARVQDLETKLSVSENEKEGYLYDLDNLRQKIEEKDSVIAEMAAGATHNFSSTPSRSIPTPLISAARQGYNKPRPTTQSKGGMTEELSSDAIVVGGRQEEARPMSRQESDEAVVHTVSDMDSKIRELRLIFHPKDPLVEREHAVVKICALVRGWLTRQRYQKYWKALYEFRYGRVRKFLCLIEADLIAAGNVESGSQSMLMKRNTMSIQKIFERWAYLCRQTAPFRRANLLAAENKYQVKRLELLQLTFSAFRGGTIGGDSHKQLRQERRAMVERLRGDLKEKQEKSGGRQYVITELEIQRAVYHEVVMTSIVKRNVRNKRKIFDHFKFILDKSHWANKTALRHKFHKYAGRCFYAWSDWTYQIGTGLERKRWPGARKYEVRYNQKLVEHFIKVRLKKMTFRPWQRFARTQTRVNIMFAEKLTRFIRNTFIGWKSLTQHCQTLRRDALAMWMGYAKDMISGPFYGWKELSANAVLRRNQQNGLVNAYVRWKQRQKHIRILQTWRHQALYGGVEGMYSRTTISKSLGEQKSMCASLQKMLARQTVDLEECKELVNREVRLRKKLEDSAVDKDGEIERLKMKGHHVDQELRRLMAIIESMATINPAQVALLKEMQPEFNFQERKVQPSLDPGGSEQGGGSVLGDSSVGMFSDTSMTDILGLESEEVMEPSGSVKPPPSAAASIGTGAEDKGAALIKKDRRASTMSTTGTEMSQDDKRLLLRIKWVISNIFPDVKPYNVLNDVPPVARQTSEQSADFSDDDDDSDSDEVDDGQYPHMTRGERRMERRVEHIMNDPADSAELSFVVGMMSFLKDGSTKCFSKKDSREWAKVLLKSVGRDTDIINSLLPDPEDDKLAHLNSPNAKPHGSLDMEDWRSVLIHLQTFYPVGEVARFANVDYEDEKNVAKLGVLDRVRTMRGDLREVVRYKVDKVSRSKVGRSLATNLTVSGEEDTGVGEDDDDQPGINMYAGNLVNLVGGEAVASTDSPDLEDSDEHEQTLEQDSKKKSQILSMHDEIMKHVTEDTSSSYSAQFTLPSGK